jgi:hypothetical protein
MKFMTGIPSRSGSTGFCMMGPDELKNQRWTYVKYWDRKIDEMWAEIRNAE